MHQRGVVVRRVSLLSGTDVRGVVLGVLRMHHRAHARIVNLHELVPVWPHVLVRHADRVPEFVDHVPYLPLGVAPAQIDFCVLPIQERVAHWRREATILVVFHVNLKLRVIRRRHFGKKDTCGRVVRHDGAPENYSRRLGDVLCESVWDASRVNRAYRPRDPCSALVRITRAVRNVHGLLRIQPSVQDHGIAHVRFDHTWDAIVQRPLFGHVA
mmetsp:Transcript_85569/g.238883  ORF Transcript_85569/g.238883 Transcript_85569/m.238883 type:complete len:213 (-) Transcript_85569:867-1505(-)